jgi:hypothetical protein
MRRRRQTHSEQVVVVRAGDFGLRVPILDITQKRKCVDKIVWWLTRARTLL